MPSKDPEKRKQATYKWRERNPEAFKRISQRYAESHRDEIAARSRKFRELNPEYGKTYYAANRDRLIQSATQWKTDNPERAKQNVVEYCERNRDALRQKAKEYYTNNKLAEAKRYAQYAKTHKDVVNAKTNRRRARKLNAKGTVTPSQWNDLKVQYGNRCLCCGVSEEHKALSMDHVIPLSAGGSNSIDNIQPLCKSCNSSKHTKTIDYRDSYQQSIAA